ncbi:MAG: hypothetical protein J0G95_17850 [Rhizobiales bacterium]|nr:hypothetical protein [Hyphomicrobiales bacterium]
MIALLLAGMVALCGGGLTVLYGISIKEFSLGGTMILAGAVVACTGLLLIGLGLVLRELKNLPHRLGGEAVAMPPPVIALTPDLPRPPLAAEPQAPVPPRPAPRPHGRADVLFSREEAAVETELPPLDLTMPERATPERPVSPAPLSRATPQPEAPSESAPPWSDEQHARTRSIPPIPRARDRVSEPSSERAGLGERPSLGERPNRNFLFSSRRREQAAEPPAHEPAPEESSAREAGADPHDMFEAPWTQPEPARAEPELTPEPEAAPRPARSASTPRYQPPRRSEAASVTVVKSGVVDSMAYSLYSDGSIEAQMPEGMVRFESIEALRAHLEQRG